MPASAVTRPPAIAGPRLRNLRCAKTSLGFSGGDFVPALAAQAAVAAPVTESSTMAALVRKEFRVIVGSRGWRRCRLSRRFTEVRNGTDAGRRKQLVPDPWSCGINVSSQAGDAWSQRG